MPDEVIDQDGDPADAQSLIDEVLQSLRRQMVREQAATDQVKTPVSKRKGKGVSGHRPLSIRQMGVRPIEQSGLQL
jgi:hypothetical protein